MFAHFNRVVWMQQLSRFRVGSIVDNRLCVLKNKRNFTMLKKWAVGVENSVVWLQVLSKGRLKTWRIVRGFQTAIGFRV